MVPLLRNRDEENMLYAILRVCFCQGQEMAPPFFRYGDGKRNYMIGRLDFVESILRRGAKGIRLRETKGECER